MIREDYTKQLNNDQMLVLLQRMERFVEFMRDAAQLGELFSNTGKELLRIRATAKEGKRALDYGEFFNFVQQRNEDAAHILGKAEVLKFDPGRLHIRFPSDTIKAKLGWHREQIEMLAEKLYGMKFRIMVKQSLPA